jgi:hypothetical protein
MHSAVGKLKDAIRREKANRKRAKSECINVTLPKRIRALLFIIGCSYQVHVNW